MKSLKIIQAISYTCNCRCDYCMNWGLAFNKQEIPVEDLIKFYDKLFLAVDNDGNINFTITGGETFHSNVVSRTTELLKWLISHPKIQQVRINTNGYFDIPDICKNSKVLLQFSLDGKKEYCNGISHNPRLYDRLMKNVKYCNENSINYQFRTVVTENIKDVPFVIKTAQKNKHKVFIQTARPVGGAKSTELIKNIDMTLELKEKYEGQDYVEIVPIYTSCSMLNPDEKDCMTMLVNPFGEIGACAFLATKYLSFLNIYNFLSFSPVSFKKRINIHIGDGTCCFPDGLGNFFNSLPKKQAEEYKKKLGVNGI